MVENYGMRAKIGEGRDCRLREEAWGKGGGGRGRYDSRVWGTARGLGGRFVGGNLRSWRKGE